MNKRDKKMLKTTIIYFIGTFSSKVLTFILLPLYTNILTVEEYGKINLLINLIPLIGPIFTMQINDGIFRFLCNETDKNKRVEYLTNSFIIFIIGIFAFSILYIPLAIIFKFNYSFLFYFYFVFNYFCLYVQQVIRGLKKNVHYSISGILGTIVQLLINVWLIKSLRERCILISAIISSFCISLYGLISSGFFSQINFNKVSKTTIKKQLKYSIPLIPNQISWWFNGIAGIYIVEYFCGTYQTGLITFANKFPNLIATINSIYFLAWTENSIYEYDSEDRNDYYSTTFEKFISFQLIFVSIIMLVVKIYSDLTIIEDYQIGLNLVPILFIAMAFNAFATLLGTIYTASMKTVEALRTTLVAAIVNIILVIILTPYIGMYGYAFSNLISYLIFLLIRMKSVNKIINMNFKLTKKMIISIIALVTTILVYYLLNIKWNYIYLISLIIFAIIFYKSIILKTIKIFKRKKA